MSEGAGARAEAFQMDLKVTEEGGDKRDLLLSLKENEDVPVALRGAQDELVTPLIITVATSEFPAWMLYKECVEARDPSRVIAAGPFRYNETFPWSRKVYALLELCQKHCMTRIGAAVEVAHVKRIARFYAKVGDAHQGGSWNTGRGPTELTHAASGQGYNSACPGGSVHEACKWLTVAVRSDWDPQLVEHYAAALGYWATLRASSNNKLENLAGIVDTAVGLIKRYAHTCTNAVNALTKTMHAWAELRSGVASQEVKDALIAAYSTALLTE